MILEGEWGCTVSGLEALGRWLEDGRTCTLDNNRQIPRWVSVQLDNSLLVFHRFEWYMLFPLPSEPLASFEVVHLQEGIPHNLNLASAASRQKFAVLLKRLTCRMRESRCQTECCPSNANGVHVVCYHPFLLRMAIQLSPAPGIG